MFWWFLCNKIKWIVGVFTKLGPEKAHKIHLNRLIPAKAIQNSKKTQHLFHWTEMPLFSSILSLIKFEKSPKTINRSHQTISIIFVYICKWEWLFCIAFQSYTRRESTAAAHRYSCHLQTKQITNRFYRSTCDSPFPMEIENIPSYFDGASESEWTIGRVRDQNRASGSEWERVRASEREGDRPNESEEANEWDRERKRKEWKSQQRREHRIMSAVMQTECKHLSTCQSAVRVFQTANMAPYP